MFIHIEQGDCLELIKDVPDNSVELILTDPPYHIGEFAKKRGKCNGIVKDYFALNEWDSKQDWENDMRAFFKEASRVLKTGGNMIVFMSILRIETIRLLAEEYGFWYSTTGIWHKTNPMPRNMNLRFINSHEPWMHFIYKAKSGVFNNDGKALHDFVEFPLTPQSEKKLGKHPTQKPVKMMEYFINILSNKGFTILDPFMGSGSTGVGAVRTGRNFIGFEREKEYFEVAERRINNENLQEL